MQHGGTNPSPDTVFFYYHDRGTTSLSYVILTSGPVLRVPLEHLRSRVLADSTKIKPHTLEEAERAHILAALKETKWVIAGPNGAAARLGLNRSTLQFYMKKLGIVKPWK